MDLDKHIMTYVHHRGIKQSSYTALKFFSSNSSLFFHVVNILCVSLMVENIISSFLYILLLLQLSHFFLPFSPYTLHAPQTAVPLLSSCPWVVHVSSLASTFPILFLTSPCLFCAYQLCFLFPVPFSLFSPASPHC